MCCLLSSISLMARLYLRCAEVCMDKVCGPELFWAWRLQLSIPVLPSYWRDEKNVEQKRRTRMAQLLVSCFDSSSGEPGSSSDIALSERATKPPKHGDIGLMESATPRWAFHVYAACGSLYIILSEQEMRWWCYRDGSTKYFNRSEAMTRWCLNRKHIVIIILVLTQHHPYCNISPKLPGAMQFK